MHFFKNYNWHFGKKKLQWHCVRAMDEGKFNFDFIFFRKLVVSNYFMKNSN